MDIMSVILIIGAAIVVWKDKDDLWRYLLVAVAAGYLARTPTGKAALDNLSTFFNFVFKTVQGWLA